MPRAGYLILLALLLAAAAGGVLVWTKNLIPEISSPPAATNVNSSGSDWKNEMAQMAGPGGMVVSFADTDSTRWSITEGHKIERFRVANEPQVIARLSSSYPLDLELRLSGLQVKLPVTWAQKVAGNRIEIGVIAKQPRANAANNLSALYATLQAGNSGWQTFKITPDFQVLKFHFDIPQVPEGYQNEPVIVLRADALGQDRAVELVGVYAKPVQ